MADNNALISALLTGHKQFNPQQLQGLGDLANNAPLLNPALLTSSYAEGQVIPQTTNPNNPYGKWAIDDSANAVPDPTTTQNIPPDYRSIMTQLNNNKYMTKTQGWDI